MLKYYYKWRMGTELWILYHSMLNDSGWVVNSTTRAEHKQKGIQINWQSEDKVEVRLYNQNWVHTDTFTFRGYAAKKINARIDLMGRTRELRDALDRQAKAKASIVARIVVGE